MSNRIDAYASADYIKLREEKNDMLIERFVNYCYLCLIE